MKIDVSTQRAKAGRFTRVIVEVSDKELARVKHTEPAGYVRKLKRTNSPPSTRLMQLYFLAHLTEGKP